MPDMGRKVDELPIALHLELWLNLTEEEYQAVSAWLEYPRMTEAEVAEEMGVNRTTFNRRLSVSFAKMREVLGGDNE